MRQDGIKSLREQMISSRISAAPVNHRRMAPDLPSTSGSGGSSGSGGQWVGGGGSRTPQRSVMIASRWLFVSPLGDKEPFRKPRAARPAARAAEAARERKFIVSSFENELMVSW